MRHCDASLVSQQPSKLSIYILIDFNPESKSYYKIEAQRLKICTYFMLKTLNFSAKARK